MWVVTVHIIWVVTVHYLGGHSTLSGWSAYLVLAVGDDVLEPLVVGVDWVGGQGGQLDACRVHTTQLTASQKEKKHICSSRCPG